MLKSSHFFESVGTLGEKTDDLTCSLVVAKRWNKAKEIKAYPLFELAAQALKENKIASMIIPGAYPQISKFIMDSQLIVSEVFIDTIPSLVLAGKYEIIPKNVDIIFHHPATAHLLSEIETKFQESIPVSSNVKACTAIENNQKITIAITNKLCADYYGLIIYKILRKGINMPFVCFTNKSHWNKDE